MDCFICRFLIMAFLSWFFSFFFLFPVPDHGEPLHILHYELGQEYQAHYDYFHDSVNTRNGGQRIATMLMYL